MDGFEGDFLKYLAAHLQNEVIVLIKFIPAISALLLLSFLKISLTETRPFQLRHFWRQGINKSVSW
jgi:hypothetical protein